MAEPVYFLCPDGIIRFEDFDAVADLYAQLKKVSLQQAKADLYLGQQEGKCVFPATLVGKLTFHWKPGTGLCFFDGGRLIEYTCPEPNQTSRKDTLAWAISPHYTKGICKD